MLMPCPREHDERRSKPCRENALAHVGRLHNRQLRFGEIVDQDEPFFRLRIVGLREARQAAKFVG